MNKEELKRAVIDYPITDWISKQSALDLIDQLDEPEKPVVPQFVAEWIEQDKQPSLSHGLFYLYSLLNDRSWVEDQKLLNWLKLDKENEKKFAIAYYVGCEVEREPKWVVKLGNGYLYEPMADVGSDGLIRLTRNKSNAYPFESKETADTHIDKFGGEAEEVSK